MRFTISCFFSLLFLTCLLSAKGENKNDSLLKITQTGNDTMKIGAYLRLGVGSVSDSSKAKSFFNSALTLAQKLNESKFLGDYYFFLANYYNRTGKRNNALEQFKLARELYASKKNYSHEIKCVFNMALCQINNNKPKVALTFFDEQLKVANASGNQKEIAGAYYNLGKCNKNLGDLRKSQEYSHQAMKIYKALNDSDGIAKLGNQMGSNFRELGDFSSAIEYYLIARKIYEKQGRKKEYAGMIVNMGFVYSSMHNKQKAMEDWLEAEKILESIGDKEYLANVRHSIATEYIDEGKYEEARERLEFASNVFKENGNVDYYANCLDAISSIHFNLKEYSQALARLQEALRIKRSIEENFGVGLIYGRIGRVYYAINDLKNAFSNYQEAIKISQKTGNIGTETNALLNMGLIKSDLGNYKEANEYFKSYVKLRDSLYKQESVEKIAEMGAIYQNEKQAAQIQLLNEQKISQEHKLKANSLLRNMLIGGLAILLVFGFLLYNRYRLKQKSNLELQSANSQIQKSRDEIIAQKKEILDSIHYAKRIQTAILPDTTLLEQNFSDHFIFYRPKDVVSGDLYWLSKVKNKMLVGAVDCTGHGVPGAFMSVIAAENLNHIVNEKQIDEPGSILSELDKKVSATFAKENSANNINDGMDIALVSIDVEKLKLKFSGASRPMIHIRNGVLTELSPNKLSIGGYGLDLKKFENHEMELEKGDGLYLFTDGYADQFGGERGKKFKYRELKRVLLEISGLNMLEQGRKLHQVLSKWKGELEQVDDICVIGIKI